MAGRCGSLSRSLLSTARSSTVRSSPSLSHLRPSQPSLLGSSFPSPSRRFLSRFAGALGCTQSLLPVQSVVASTHLTSHVTVEACACCELSQGIFFSRTCPDR